MSERTRKAIYMVLAILIAIVGWAFVVYNYYPMTDVRYNGVKIQFVGEDTLAQRGYGVVSTSTDEISVVLNQNRVRTGSISSDDITVIADVSEAVKGDNGISLTIVPPDGTSVTSTETRSITVDVEKVDTLEAKIYVAYSDALDVSAEPIATALTIEEATVVGAASEISSVDRVMAYLSYSEVSETARSFTRELVAVDADGNELPHMVIYPYEVSFEASAGFTKAVELRLNVLDASEDGFVRTWVAPEQIVIKGSRTAIEEITYIETEDISVTRMTEDGEIELTYILPEGITLANGYEGLVMTVTVREATGEDDTEGDTETDTGEDSGETDTSG